MWSLTPWKKSDGGGMFAAEPFEREFSRIRSEFDSLFNRMWSGFPFGGESERGLGWGLDVEETETHFVARVPAPGFEIEDFNVHVSGNHLIVEAEHKEEAKSGKNGGSSFRYGSVHQMILLPEGAKTEHIDASYHKGILELKIPKGKEAKSKRITVKAG